MIARYGVLAALVLTCCTTTNQSGTGVNPNNSTSTNEPPASGPPSLQLALDAGPYSAGSTHTLTVTARSADGNVVTSYLGIVDLSSSDPNAQLPRSIQFSAVDAGTQAVSDVVFATAGTQTLVAQDTNVTATHGSLSDIAVVAGPAAEVVLAVQPNTIAGVPMPITLTTYDGYRNRANYTGTVYVASSDPGPLLQLPPPIHMVDQNTVTVANAVALVTAGVQTLAGDSTDLDGLDTAVNVTPGPAASLTTVGADNALPAGIATSLTITPYDLYGNVAYPFAGAVGFTSSDPNAEMPAQVRFVAGSGLLTVSNVTLRTAGLQTVTVVDPNGVLTGSTWGMEISAAAAVGLRLQSEPPWLVGQTMQVVVTAQDAYGNVAPGYTDIVELNSGGNSNGTLPISYHFKIADLGMSVQQFSFTQTGNQTVNAGDSSTSSPSFNASVTQNVVSAGGAGVAAHLGNHTCATFSDGSATCWGQNSAGQLGLGDTNSRGTKLSQMRGALGRLSLGTGRTVSALGTGAAHTCALLDNAAIKCWGANDSGQLGLGDPNGRGAVTGQMGDALPEVDLNSHTVTHLALGTAHTCVVRDDSSLTCWGANAEGQLGVGDANNRGSHAADMGANLTAVALPGGHTAAGVAAGNAHTCALLDDGNVTCWGANDQGQLGAGDTLSRGATPSTLGDALPLVPLGTGRTATLLDAGTAHTCALLDNGSVACWGANDQGQLGVGDTTSRGTQPDPSGAALLRVNLGTGRTAVGVAAGAAHSCAALDNGTIKCWGANTQGQLGVGDGLSRGGSPADMGNALPAVALGVGRTSAAVVASAQVSCALLDSTGVKCWGLGADGQLGLGDATTRGNNFFQMGDALTGAQLW